MTQFLRQRLTVLGGTRPADIQGWNWRQVPKVSILSSQRRPRITPLIIALLVVMLAEGLALQYLYRELSSTNDRATTARSVLDEIEGLKSVEEGHIADEEAKIKAIDDQINQLEEQGDRASQAYSALTAARTDWEASLRALLAVDSPDIRFTKVTTKPDGTIVVTWTVAGIDAMGRFQGHMRDVDDILGLRSFQWEQQPGDDSLTFIADIVVR